jgi:hypothetical protein
MKGSVEGEARKALNRLRRAIEKVAQELTAVDGTLRTAEGADFPAEEFTTMQSKIADLHAFVDEQAERLEDKILHAGGLEPGRVRRTS